MNPKANAVLATLLTSTTKGKHTRFKTESFGTPVPKGEDAERVRIALVDASNGWSGVKRECVLLKKRG